MKPMLIMAMCLSFTIFIYCFVMLLCTSNQRVAASPEKLAYEAASARLDLNDPNTWQQDYDEYNRAYSAYYFSKFGKRLPWDTP